MSHSEIVNGQRLRKRDVADELRKFIDRYDFYDKEVHRLWKDYEELEAENTELKSQNTRLKEACENLLLENMDYRWNEMFKANKIKRSCRKYLSKSH